MAGRFLIKKFSSQLCGSRSLFSVPARAGAPAPGGIRIPSNNIHGAAHHSKSFPNNCGIHGFVARNSDISPCVAADTSCLTTENPATIINGKIPAFANRAFSASASTRHEISKGVETPAWQAPWDALDAKLAAKDAEFNKFMRTQKWLCGFACFSCLFGFFLEEVLHHIRSTNGQNVPHGCSSCSIPAAASDGVQSSKMV